MIRAAMAAAFIAGCASDTRFTYEARITNVPAAANRAALDLLSATFERDASGVVTVAHEFPSYDTLPVRDGALGFEIYADDALLVTIIRIPDYCERTCQRADCPGPFELERESFEVDASTPDTGCTTCEGPRGAVKICTVVSAASATVLSP